MPSGIGAAVVVATISHDRIGVALLHLSSTLAVPPQSGTTHPSPLSHFSRYCECAYTLQGVFMSDRRGDPHVTQTPVAATRPVARTDVQALLSVCPERNTLSLRISPGVPLHYIVVRVTLRTLPRVLDHEGKRDVPCLTGQDRCWAEGT